MMAWWLGGNLGAQGHLVWAAPALTAWIAGLGAVVALALAARGLRAWRWRVLELGLFALALAGGVLALMQPVWVEEEGRTAPGRLVVLADASASMAVKDGASARSAQVDAWLSELSAQPGVEVLHFGTDLRAGAPVDYSLSGTDLGVALAGVVDRYAGENLAGIVLLSDGIDRGSLRYAWKQGLEPEVPKLPGPLTTIAVGRLDGLKDLSVSSVDAGGFAYLRTPFRLHATLSGTGFGERKIPVTLSRDGALVTTQSVTLDASGHGEVTFEVRPESVGRFAYEVRIPDYEDDAVPGNNALPVVIKVVRDRVRVLQVAGAPSWDLKFLRRFLKGDPSIDLVSFFILRTVDDRIDLWREDELSLISFPYIDLLTTELPSFDLVIFQNFDYAPYFYGMEGELFQNLRKRITDDGLGFMMIGGDRSFGQGNYESTPLASVLPVRIAPSKTPPDEAPFQAVLTEAGARHPITRLAQDMQENADWWKKLHTLDGVQLGLSASPEATVLLTHPTLRGADGGPAPVLAVQEAGKGRTLALAVDSSWRWSLSEAAQGRGNQAYLRFWKNAIRWLVRDPSADRVSTDPDRENYALGDTIHVVTQVRDEAFEPIEGAEVSLSVVVRGHLTHHDARTNSDGIADISWVASEHGAYRASAEVTRAGRKIGASESVFAVTSRDPELEDVRPDAAFMNWLAQRAGGRFLDADQPISAASVLRDPTADRLVWDTHETAIWRSPALMAWITLFAGLAWIVRRHAGLR